MKIGVDLDLFGQVDNDALSIIINKCQLKIFKKTHF